MIFKRWLIVIGIATLIGTANLPAQQAPLPPGSKVDEPQHAANPSDDSLTAAETALETKNFDAARTALEKYLRDHPTDARALFDLGYVEDAQEHVDAAIAAYRKAAAADPKQFESRLALGLLLARQGQNAEARQQLEAATALEPDPPSPTAKAQAFRALARLDQTSDPAAAKTALLKALALSPESPDDTLLIAGIAESSGDDQTALEAYRRVLTKQPESSAATAGLVHLLLKDKKYAEAEPLLRSALSRDPNDPALNSQLASTLAAQDKMTEAIAVLEKLRQLEPASQQVSAMLADAYTQNGNAAKADPIYLQLLKDAPDNPDILISRGENLIRQQRYSEALPILQQAVKFKPDDGDAWSDLAFSASELKQNAITLQSLTMRSKYLEDTPATYFLRATAYDNLHQTKQAAEYYKKFLQAAHGNFPDQEWQAQHRLVALEKTQ
jgi:tetratricopeptide (TPR) repeat protein